MIRQTVIFSLFFLLISVSCTPPIILSVSTNQSNKNDTIIVYTDASLLNYNNCQVYDFNKETGLYKFTLTNSSDPLVVLKKRIPKCGYFDKCRDSARTHLPISYLKFIGKGCDKVYIEEAKTKDEILDFFKKGENGRVVFAPCELK